MAAIAAAAVVFAASVYQGAEQKKLKEQEAVGYQEAAQRRIAAGTHEVREEARVKQFTYSRALAVSAASGTATGSAGVVKLLGDLNAEGDYRMLARMYTAQSDAEGLGFRAEQALREGDAAQQAGVINGVVSAFSAYSGFAPRGGAPSATAPTTATAVRRTSRFAGPTPQFVSAGPGRLGSFR